MATTVDEAEAELADASDHNEATAAAVNSVETMMEWVVESANGVELEEG